MLPADEAPEHTEGYEGFYHLIGITGEVEQTTVSYIIRDHDRTRFEERKKEMERLVAKINEEYGPGTATLELRDQYYNMREQIEPVMHIIDTAFAAMKAVGVEPRVKAIRRRYGRRPGSLSRACLVPISLPVVELPRPL